MEIRNSGKVKKEIERFHKVLNHKDVVPAQSFKRNATSYAFVTHVNHTIALIASSNYELIPFQINRAFKAVDRIIDKPVYENYCNLAFRYLRNVIFFLKEYTEISDSLWEFCIESKSIHIGTIPSNIEEIYHCDIEGMKLN